MSDFTDWVQKELPVRPSVNEVAATGSLLVKKANVLSRDYEALDQGISGQILKSQGVDLPPIWGTVGGGASTTTLHNDNVGTITFGQPVYLKSNGHIDLACADSETTYKVIALVAEDEILTDTDGTIQPDDLITGTTDQWDVVTGETGGLTPGDYYLSTTPGMLTKIVPITDILLPVGTALNTTEFKINILHGIKL